MGDWECYAKAVVGNRLIFAVNSPKTQGPSPNGAWFQIFSVSAAAPKQVELLGEFHDPVFLPRSATDHPIQFIVGAQRWQTDGTRVGTHSVGNQNLALSAGIPLSQIWRLPTTKPSWFFAYNDPKAGREPWLLASNPPRIGLLRDTNLNPADVFLDHLYSVGDTWYFSYNHVLWMSQGKPSDVRAVRGFPAHEIGFEAMVVANSKALYLLTKAKSVFYVWQVQQGQAHLITKSSGWISAQLYASATGVYLYSQFNDGRWQLQHWNANHQSMQLLLPKAAPNQSDLLSWFEIKQGAIYQVSNETTTMTGESITKKPLRWLNTKTQQTVTLAEDLPNGGIFKTSQHLYVLQGIEGDGHVLLRINLSRQRLEPVKDIPPLIYAEDVIAGSYGVYFSSSVGDKPRSLWYLADNATRPIMLKQFKEWQIVRLMKTQDQALYFNINTSINSELWLSEGSKASTRRIKRGVAMR